MAERGRPTVMTSENIAKLEEAFLNGATDKEAMFIADISSSTFYDYCKENPEFAERKEALKDMVKYRARQNIVSAINDGDKTLSQWYLERKAKDEFSQRTEQTGKDGKDLVPDTSGEVRELANKFDDFLKEHN
jgi:hypothetical protein